MDVDIAGFEGFQGSYDIVNQLEFDIDAVFLFKTGFLAGFEAFVKVLTAGVSALGHHCNVYYVILTGAGAGISAFGVGRGIFPAMPVVSSRYLIPKNAAPTITSVMRNFEKVVKRWAILWLLMSKYYSKKLSYWFLWLV